MRPNERDPRLDLAPQQPADPRRVQLREAVGVGPEVVRSVRSWLVADGEVVLAAAQVAVEWPEIAVERGHGLDAAGHDVGAELHKLLVPEVELLAPLAPLADLTQQR